jgi:hypothetical protein
MRRVAYASAAVILFFIGYGGCAKPKLPPPPREPPPRVLAVALDRIALRTNAYVELHAWLAAAGRSSVAPPPGLDAAVDVYRQALAKDDGDVLLASTTAALGACSDDRCALAALERTPYRRAWSGSFDTFVARWWTERANLARTGVEIAREAFSVESEGLLGSVARDVGVEWPERPVAVDIVVESPPAGHDALVTAVLPVHGPCFVRDDGEQLRHARMLDCVLVRALFPLRESSKRGAMLDERAWQLLVIHAVAATISSWEAKHVSPSWRSAYAVEPQALDWLKKNYAPSDEAFVTRWKEAWPKLARAARDDRRENP